MAKWFTGPSGRCRRELAVGLQIVAGRIAGQGGKDGNSA
jgi:hypothetical protein